MARRLTKNDIISNIYYDPAEGFGSVKAILKRAKEEDSTITTNDVKAFLKNNPTSRLESTEDTIPTQHPLPVFSIR